MPIDSPLSNDTRSQFADWLEVLALVRPRHVATRSEVLGLLDLLEPEDSSHGEEDDNGEKLDEEILEDQRLAAADDVLDEFTNRQQILGGLYPFDVAVRGASWSIQPSEPAAEDETEIARLCYKFCLLTSAIRDKRIKGKAVPVLEASMPVHFQALSTESAAEVIGGVSFSFGWPRPDASAFRPALSQLHQQLMLGAPLTFEPLWSSGKEKDAGVDVVAWREFDDAQPGKLILFGQVASGNDWTTKSIKNDTPGFFSWYSERPTEHHIPAIFIPFPQHHECKGKKFESFEAVAFAQAWLREQEFGLVVDRLRIVGTAARRIHRENNKKLVSDLKLWVESALTTAAPSQ